MGKKLVPFIGRTCFILEGSHVMLNAMQNCINYARLSLSDKGIKFCGFTLAASHKTKPFVVLPITYSLPSTLSPYPFRQWPCLWPAMSARLSTLKARHSHLATAVIIIIILHGVDGSSFQFNFLGLVSRNKGYCGILCSGILSRSLKNSIFYNLYIHHRFQE